jgi:hypothetical protein
MDELQAEKEAQKNLKIVSYKELLFASELRRPLIAAIVIVISQVGFRYSHDARFEFKNKFFLMVSDSMHAQW